MRFRKRLHRHWPWNPTMVYCPADGHYHSYGCQHIRRAGVKAVPASLRDMFARAWTWEERRNR